MGLFTRYKSKSDEQLMVLVQQGDHRAFSALYDRYATKMKAYFFRMLWSDEALAEDYVHDLFEKLIERPELFKADYPFSPWLYRVASNMCKNAYRKRQFEEEYRNQLEHAGIQVPMQGRQLDEQLMLDQLHLALEQLDEDRKELFLLRYQQQLSTKELAEVFETSEGTIKSRLHYIRKSVAATMGKEK